MGLFSNLGIGDKQPPSPQRPEWGEEPEKPRGLLAYIKSKFGGWLGPRLSQGSEAAESLEEEQAAAGPRGIIFSHFPPYFSDITRESGAARTAYREMIGDPNVKAALLAKLFGLASSDLRIHPYDKKNYQDGAIADWVNYNLTERVQGGLMGMIWEIFSGGLVDGYSVCEKVWEYEDRGAYRGNIALGAIKSQNVGENLILETDPYRNVVRIKGLLYNSGEFWAPEEFVLYKHLPFFQAPTGMSDFRAAYEAWWYLTVVKRLWAIACEKRAIPFIVGQYATTAQKPSLERALGLAKSQTWISLPESVKFTVLDAVGHGPEVFEKFCTKRVHEIFLGIQGAILQQLEGTTTDGRGSSKVHESTADLLKYHLGACFESLLNDRNGVIRDVVDLNYVVSGGYPRATMSSLDVARLVQELAIDSGLNKMVMLSKEDIYDRYGRRAPTNKEDEIPVAPQPGAGQAGAGPESPLQSAQDAVKRETAVDHADQIPAQEVAGVAPFRFSEEWGRWLGYNGRGSNGNGHATNGRGIR